MSSLKWESHHLMVSSSSHKVGYFMCCFSVVISSLPPSLPSLPPLGTGSKSATGLMEWSEPDGAMDAFVMANHQTIYSSSKCRWNAVSST